MHHYKVLYKFTSL